MSEAGEKPIKSPGIPQSLIEIAQMEIKIKDMDPQERLGLVAVDPFRVLGFNEVKSTNLLSVPDRQDIELACEKKENDLFELLKNPNIKGDIRKKVIILWITLPEIKAMTIMLSSLSRSINLNEQTEARKIIKLFNDNRDDPKLGFAELEKTFAQRAKNKLKQNNGVISQDICDSRMTSKGVFKLIPR